MVPNAKMPMPLRASLLAALAVAALQPATAGAQATGGAVWSAGDLDAVEDGQFRCPETLATGEEKINEIARFLAWAKAHHPAWTLEQTLDFRVAVLRHNKCTRTLANIEGSG